jgi:acetaldehyde dehydrogenase/alcohol dehydrogenase
VPSTIKEVVGEAKEQEFMASLDELASQAFDDQCTGANPRYPLISDLKQVCGDGWMFAWLASGLT